MYPTEYDKLIRAIEESTERMRRETLRTQMATREIEQEIRQSRMNRYDEALADRRKFIRRSFGGHLIVHGLIWLIFMGPSLFIATPAFMLTFTISMSIALVFYDGIQCYRGLRWHNDRVAYAFEQIVEYLI